MSTYYRNESLFSEIYLDEITQESKTEEVSVSLKILREYRDFADTTDNEQWVESYVKEVLSALGFSVRKEKNELFILSNFEKQDLPISICLILGPDDDLNNVLMGRNWMEKTIRALRKHNFEWGLLTNGKYWRILHKTEPSPYETYLEIDLDAILKNQELNEYKIFHQFMRAMNFILDSKNQCKFDQYKKESKDKINYIENELINALKPREEGGHGVLSDICMGYVEAIRRGENKDYFDNEENRQKIYHGAMLYMFRLLFLFYADARDLLSIENHNLLEDVIDVVLKSKNEKCSYENEFNHWQVLESIFVDIDQTYNGGLFSPQESEFTKFIEENRINNEIIETVLFNLATYKEKNGSIRNISYKDMGVRHLGTLYEGLLEHKLFIAKEDTEVRLSKGKIRFIPVSKGGKLNVGKYIPAGFIYFASDPNERKTTGSYFTPEFIVDYIIQNTIGKKLEELKNKFLDREKNNLQALSYAIDKKEKKMVSTLLEENAINFINEIVLQLSVLDPAMGSGHFLVNATNLISNSITEILNELDIEGNISTGTYYWRRKVVEHCIFGVDINPLAVELAKLSLWILSMAKTKPLSFLKHNLKHGNSLVGARIEDLGKYPFSTQNSDGEQISIFTNNATFKDVINNVFENYSQIISKESSTLEDIEEKKDFLTIIENNLSIYKELFKLHTELFFGNKLTEYQYNEILKNKTNHINEKSKTKEKYIFWDLDYPVQLLKMGGFDCVVGNPPYNTIIEDFYLKHNDKDGVGNLFSHFLSKAIDINSQSGSIGFIVPLSFACGSAFELIRKKIFKNYRSLYTSHFSIRPAKIFPGVDQRVTIILADEKDKSETCHLFSSRLWRFNESDKERIVKSPEYGYFGEIKSGIVPKIAGQIGADIFHKISDFPNNLKELVCKDGNFLGYYHSVARYWIKAYNFIPFFQRENSVTSSRSTKLNELKFLTEEDRDFFILIINSSLFYYYWIAVGDEFDVLKKDIEDFRFNKNSIQNEHKYIKNLVEELMNDYKKNSQQRTSKINGKKIIYQEFYPRKSEKIISKIDDFVSNIFKFSEEEQKFLKQYDHSFRKDN